MPVSRPIVLADCPCARRAVNLLASSLGLLQPCDALRRRGLLYPTKTEASEGVLPLDSDLAEMLLAHKAGSTYGSDSDFVFAGDSGNPRWPETMLVDYIKPAARKAGIGSFGWHTFRHTYSTLLHVLGTASAVQKELLRHANVQTTLNVYTQAVTTEKRKAASKIADVLWRM
jgi:integrase